jgi:hypothetical protein
MSYASRFVPSPIANNEILTAGSRVLFAPLATVASSEPAVTTLSVDTGSTLAIGTTTIPMTTSAGTGTPLKAGTALYFSGTNKVVVAANVTVATGASPTNVTVEPTTATLADGATATTWNLVSLLSPSDIPNVSTDTMVDRKDLTFGLQGSQVKVGTAFQPQIAAIVNPNDEAFYQVIYPASNGAESIFVHLVYNGGLHAWGPAKVSNLNIPGPINEIQRMTFTLDFQAPYAKPTKWQYLSAGLKTDLNDVMKLSGLSIYA